MSEPAPTDEFVGSMVVTHGNPTPAPPEPVAEQALDRVPGQPIAALVCSTPTCGFRGHHVQIYDDTTLPVVCGGCHVALHCDHAWEPVTIKATLEDPVHHDFTFCDRCKTATGAVDRHATADELRALLPPGTRTALGI